MKIVIDIKIVRLFYVNLFLLTLKCDWIRSYHIFENGRNTQIRTKRDEMDLVRAELREVIRELRETTQLLRG